MTCCAYYSHFLEPNGLDKSLLFEAEKLLKA